MPRDLAPAPAAAAARDPADPAGGPVRAGLFPRQATQGEPHRHGPQLARVHADHAAAATPEPAQRRRSEEHTSELQSLMRISYAVFCLKKKNKQDPNTSTT